MGHDPSIAAALRTEFARLPLEVVAGSYPDDLAGHLFVMAPVGNVGTAGFPGPRHDSVLNGDGMVYRVDFAANAATIKTRLVRSADFYTDAAAERDRRYARFRFQNAGIVRLSPALGARDYGNTALCGFRLASAHERLAVTFDAGRPLEIDPYTLDVVTPIGAVDEWRAEALPDLPFPPILTTAHPVADVATGDMFLVNYGRSLASIMTRSLPLQALLAAPHLLAQLNAPLSGLFGLRDEVRVLARATSDLMSRSAHQLAKRMPWLARQLPDDFLYLVRWRGQGPVERLRVVDAQGEPLRVGQTMHQLAVTRRYVVLMDSSMKFTADQAYNSPFRRFEFLERALREATTGPQQSFTRLLFIAREELARPRQVRGERAVMARTVTVPLEAVHFVADYDDDDDLVTLHIAHDVTLDIAEWVRDYDRLRFGRGHSPRPFWGIPNVTPLEINRLARYVVHAPSATVRASTVVSDDSCMWGLSLYAGEGIGTPGPLPGRLRSMFHVSPGFMPELVTEFIYDLYADYPHRMTSLETLERMAESGGRPCAIFRVDLEHYRIDHARDVLVLPPNAIAGSLQYVPKSTGAGGYLVTFVVDGGDRQIWILDPERLAQGPLCVLRNRELVFGATLHSWWLPALLPRDARYYIAPERDYGPRIRGNPLIEELFEREVYPHFRDAEEA